MERRHAEHAAMPDLEDGHLDDHRERHRHEDHAGDRQQQREAGGERHHRERRAERERAGVAHEDLGGMDVEPQEGGDGAGHDGTEDQQERVAAGERDERERDEREDDRPPGDAEGTGAHGIVQLGRTRVPIGDVEHIGDQLQIQALSDRNLLRHPQVVEDSPRSGAGVAAESAVELQQGRRRASKKEAVDARLL